MTDDVVGSREHAQDVKDWADRQRIAGSNASHVASYPPEDGTGNARSPLAAQRGALGGETGGCRIAHLVTERVNHRDTGPTFGWSMSSRTSKELTS